MIEERIKKMEEVYGRREKKIDPKFGFYDRGLNSRLKQPISVWDRVKKYTKRAALSAILAAGVLLPSYSCSAMADNSIEEKVKGDAQIEKVERRRSKGYFDYVRGAFDGKYDNHNNFHTDSLENLLGITHKIYGHLTVEETQYDYSGPKVKKTKSEKTLTYHGSAVVIENNGTSLKLLSVSHVVEDPQFPNVRDKQGRLLKTYRIKEKSYVLEQRDMFLPMVALPFIGTTRISVGPELRVVARDAKHDIAILETKEKVSGIEKYKSVPVWGNSKELEEGDFLYIIGYPRNLGKHVMSGRVSSKGNPDFKGDDYYIWADATINKGNSGGPVFALRDGKPELVGVVRHKAEECLGGIVKIEYVKKLLKKARLGKILAEDKR